MPSPFQIASAIEQTGEGKFKATIPLHWDQGRGAFGGLVLGVLARAMQAVEPDPRRSLRAIIGDICGPVLPGPIEVSARVLRRGNTQTNVQAELQQAGEVLSVGSAVLAGPRKVALPDFHLETPKAPPPWDEVPVFPIGPPLGPAFAQFLEFRLLRGMPFSGASTSDVEGYLRLAEQEGPLDAASLIALLDAHWPGTMSMASEPRANATVSFAGQIFCEPESLDALEPLYYRARIVAGHAGYFLELRELWSHGVCVAMNQQTLALIR